MEFDRLLIGPADPSVTVLVDNFNITKTSARGSLEGLIKPGANTLAVYCAQVQPTEQFIDAGIVALPLGMVESGTGLIADNGGGPRNPVTPPNNPTNPPKPPNPKAGKVIRLRDGHEGYAGVMDTKISVRRVTEGTNPKEANFGGQNRMRVGMFNSNLSRGLIRFNLKDKVPEGKEIESAKLRLKVVNGDAGARVNLYMIHPNNASWKEGDGKLVSDQGQKKGASWVSPVGESSKPWLAGGNGLGNPGVGYLSRSQTPASPVSSAQVGAEGSVMVFDIPLNALTPLLENPAMNAGYLIRLADETSDNVLFHSSESDEAGARPELVITLKK